MVSVSPDVDREGINEGMKFREWGFIGPPEYFSETAAAARAAFGR
jgi:hypothetical protein